MFISVLSHKRSTNTLCHVSCIGVEFVYYEQLFLPKILYLVCTKSKHNLCVSLPKVFIDKIRSLKIIAKGVREAHPK